MEAKVASEAAAGGITESPIISSGKATDLQSNARSLRPRPVLKETEGEFEVEAKDLELLESRISELERYLGVEDMDLQYFYELDGEDLNKKS